MRALQLQNRRKYYWHFYQTVENMHELIWASDIVISKPGAVTMAEVMSLGKPMIAVNPLGGSAQELRAARFLQESGSGVWIESVGEIGAWVKELHGDKCMYRKMCRNAKAQGRHNLRADRTIFENIKRTLDDHANRQ